MAATAASSSAGAAGQPVRQRSRAALWAGRAVAVYYGLLALIPTTNLAAAGYYYATSPSPVRPFASSGTDGDGGDDDESTDHNHSNLRHSDYEALVRGNLFYSLMGYLSLPLSAVVLAAAPLVWALDWDQRSFYHDLSAWWARTSSAPFVVPEVTGATDRLPGRDKAAVYVSNHRSWLDIFMLFWVDDLPLRFVFKQSIMYIPLVGWNLTLLGHIPVTRASKTSRTNVLQRCREALARDKAVFFFPEGTRSKDPRGALQPFKIGAFKLAVEEGVPIVPLTIRGTGELMPPGKELHLGKPGRGSSGRGSSGGGGGGGGDGSGSGRGSGCSGGCKVIVHPPVEPLDGETPAELRDRVFAIIDGGLR
eukprot:g139.t1